VDGERLTVIGEEMLRRIATVLEMIKFAHSVFALPFAAIAVLLAGRDLPGGWAHLGQIGLILVCMVAARSVAMTFNRIADADIDARNPRTAGRALPAGALTRAFAWGFLLTMAVLFCAGCTGFWRFYGNRWPMLLGVPVLLVLCGYSYAKRFTSLSHVWLGLSTGLAPVGAWVAISPGTLGLPAVVLGAVVLLWMVGFDIIYSLQDIEIDRRDGLFSLPARVGPSLALLISRVCHVVVVLLLLCLGFLTGMGLIWTCGVAAVGVLLAVEQSMVSPTDFSRVNVAFFTMNGIVSIVLALGALGDILVGRL
jgi:4-hydroxybenzoate polyprenyltransferase